MTQSDQKKPRHLMIVYSNYPLGETRVQREAETLIRNGYEVDVIGIRLPGEIPYDEYKGVKIYRQKIRLPKFLSNTSKFSVKFLRYIYFLLSASFRATQLQLKNHYTSVQTHNLPDFLVFSAWLPKLMGVPIILDLHDLMPEFYAGRTGKSTSPSSRLVRWQERMSCKFADHVITVSEHWRQALIQRGVSENKCSVVMNVADEDIFHPSNEVDTPKKDIKCFRLVYHGTFVERYGLDLAIRAVHRLRSEIPGIHLLLIGRGEFSPTMTRLIDELNLREYVTLDKLHLAEELPGIIQACDLGIVPYRNDVFTDGLLPTKLMEYAALGLPAIASRTTAIQAYFSDANTEFFEPGNEEDLVRCIRSLYQNPDRLAELARGCQKFNQRYNWTNIGAQYFALVKRLGKS